MRVQIGAGVDVEQAHGGAARDRLAARAILLLLLTRGKVRRADDEQRVGVVAGRIARDGLLPAAGRVLDLVRVQLGARLLVGEFHGAAARDALVVCRGILFFF